MAKTACRFSYIDKECVWLPMSEVPLLRGEKS